MSHIKPLLIGALIFINAVVLPAWADSSVAVPQARSVNAPQIVIAVLPFNQPDSIGVDLASVVDHDLVFAGAVKSLPRRGIDTLFAMTPTNEFSIDFATLRSIGAQYVVTGNVTGNNLRLMMFEVQTATAVLGFDLPGLSSSTGRYVAHEASDLVYEKLTGFKGAASTLMAYVAAGGYGTSKRFQLIVSEIDGANPRNVALSREPLMSPSWSPDRKQLAFVGFEKAQPAIYIQTLGSGVVRKLVSEPGINGSPAWSPDGKSIAVTLSLNASPDIYIIDVESGARRRLTDAPGIDTEAAWAPDGNSIIFTSDRSGQPQIYEVLVSGGEPRLLTKIGKQNFRASYAPDGKKIVFVNYQDGVYRIAVMDLITGEVNFLGNGPLDESPCFSPNGRAILYYASAPEGSGLVRVSIDGRARMKMRFSGNSDVREPAWSPLRQ